MKTHIIVDFTHMYYKYKFAIEYGKMKRLTNSKGEDVSVQYYVLREIEKNVKELSKGGEVYVTICMDSKTNRKEENRDYKEGRVGLSVEEKDEVGYIGDILRSIGYEVLKFDGYEADDLVNYVARHTVRNNVLIVSNDKDILVNVREGVRVKLYRNTGDTVVVDRNNYESVLNYEIPYNSIMLYKCTVGDSSDNIKGIKGFGKKAWEKVIGSVQFKGWTEKEDFKGLDTKEGCAKYIGYLLIEGFISEEGQKQALDSLELVAARWDESWQDEVYGGEGIDTKKEEVFSSLGFVSLI
jgi:DNA polymerase-1